MELDERNKSFKTWLSGLPITVTSTAPLEADASNRRYIRIFTKTGTYVAMDAPPPTENIKPFVAISAALQKQGLKSPSIYASDFNQGFLLLSDFGDQTYLRALNTQNVEMLYEKALHALSLALPIKEVNEHTLPPFNADFMWQEWAWHKEWFLQKWLDIDYSAAEKKLDNAYAALIDTAITQPQGFMYRDFHAGNLMLLPCGDVGLLDFQDAFIGPITYDLASLLRDCYIVWKEPLVKRLALSYLKKLQAAGMLTGVNATTFLKWFDYLSIQRHLKALLTFARKKVRDQDNRYLTFIPQTINYISEESAPYPELAALSDFICYTVRSKVAKSSQRG